LIFIFYQFTNISTFTYFGPENSIIQYYKRLNFNTEHNTYFNVVNIF